MNPASLFSIIHGAHQSVAVVHDVHYDIRSIVHQFDTIHTIRPLAPHDHITPSPSGYH